MPRIGLDTRIVVVQHERETYKPTSTAGLLLRMFPNSAHVVFGALDGRYASEHLTRSDYEYAVLFPRPDATPIEHITSASSTGQPTALVVLDGTWSQCSRMSRRAERVRGMPFVKLPPGTPSPWSIRRSNDPTRLCTFEAALRALAILEGTGPELVSAERMFQEVSARALFMRSKLKSPDIPTEWSTHLETDAIR